MKYYPILLVSLLSASTYISGDQASVSVYEINGYVVSQSGLPVEAASLILSELQESGNGKVIAAVVTDSIGGFCFKTVSRAISTLVIDIMALGYKSMRITIAPGDSKSALNICLESGEIKTKNVLVLGNRENGNGEEFISGRQLIMLAKRSLCQTNPVGALKSPEFIHVGSNHSSKIRVHGTNPIYKLNGVSIGQDPNHYGMFNIIPGTIVDEICIEKADADIGSQSPSQIDIRIREKFIVQRRFDFDLSVLEGTSTLFYGGEHYFVSGAYRKSILDKISKIIESNSTRRAIPPTSFQDVFISGGIKLWPGGRIFLEQYYAADALNYVIAPTSNNPSGLETRQSSHSHFVSARLEQITKDWNLSLDLASQVIKEEYRAIPKATGNNSGIAVDLSGEQGKFQSNFEISNLGDHFNMVLGNQMALTPKDKAALIQRNWNFLPPDASSDFPFIYQKELNDNFGIYNDNKPDWHNSTYAGISGSAGILKYECGLREEYFSGLAKGVKTLVRNKLGAESIYGAGIFFFYGTYAETPLSRITEPYQVLIRSNYASLTPIESKHYGVDLIAKNLEISMFIKSISQLPIIDPDFDKIDDDGSREPGFLIMISAGEMESRGIEISCKFENIFSSKFNIQSNYSWSESKKRIREAVFPYEYDAPHKFYLDIEYRAGNRLTIGSELNIRTGFPYTAIQFENISDSVRYSSRYFREYTFNQNNRRFPMYMNLNLYSSYEVGRMSFFVTILNATNEKNPIIYTSDGEIYDIGIIPSIGIKLSF